MSVIGAQCPAGIFPDYGFDPTNPDVDSKQFAVEFLGVVSPTTTTTGELDYVAAVDFDGNIVGCGPVGGDGTSAFGNMQVYFNCGDAIPQAVNCDLATCATCESFQIYYYDTSEDLYYAVLDANDAPLSFPFIDSNTDDIIDGFGGTDVAAGNTDTTVNVTINDMVFEDLFALLPIDLTLFTARQSDKFVALNWTTASEDGNASFSVERSADGVEFISLGEVSGAGTSRQAIDYTFNDEAPLRGQNYYRLRQNDFSGSYSYSDVVVVSFEGGNQIGLEVSPNPATDHVRVQLTGEWLETARVMLTDLNGKMIADLKYVTTSSFDVELSHLPAGIYQLQVTDGNNRLTQRVIVR